MAFTTQSFNSGAVLTASMMNVLHANFTAVASRTTGAPKVIQTNHAWVRFANDGTIESSEGVSSVSRSQLGEYTVTWTTPFSGYYAVCWGDQTQLAVTDPSIRNFRAFPTSSGSVLVTYSAANNTGNAKEDQKGTISAWQV